MNTTMKDAILDGQFEQHRIAYYNQNRDIKPGVPNSGFATCMLNIASR